MMTKLRLAAVMEVTSLALRRNSGDSVWYMATAMAMRYMMTLTTAASTTSSCEGCAEGRKDESKEASPQKDMAMEKKTVMGLSKRKVMRELRHESFSFQKSHSLSQSGHMMMEPVLLDSWLQISVLLANKDISTNINICQKQNEISKHLHRTPPTRQYTTPTPLTLHINHSPRLVEVGEHDEEAADESKGSQHSSRNEHLGVEAQPGEVESHLVPEVAAHHVNISYKLNGKCAIGYTVKRSVRGLTTTTDRPDTDSCQLRQSTLVTPAH
ncbi:hypothetical protein E2C01_010355 [Portunus trituberculatus]|uniref:Uncharacterized protein n=1 Tax=Portunus trituberculatus TaxID=210409 RepID=A0A5B7D8E7_PORTR|nr:hypothetical protein [Portunus trituberculatus]